MPDQQLRAGFQRDLEEIDGKVVQLFALVGEGVAAATDSFLSGDRAAAKALLEQDTLIDSLYHDVERLVQHQFALQTPMARDLRFLLSVLRIVPELERSGDLAEHIAQRAAAGLAGRLTPSVRGRLEQMGTICVDLWRRAADAWAERDSEAAAVLDQADDRLDDLHDRLVAELAQADIALADALQTTLVARFYERLGDHAVHITERVRYLAHGS